MMANVSRGQQFSSPARSNRFPHKHAVHDDVRASAKIFRGEFVFCGNIRFQSVGLGIKRNLLPSAQVGQRDQHVIFRIEFEHLVLHFTRTCIFPFCSRLQPRPAFPPHCRTRHAISRVLASQAVSTSRTSPHFPPARPFFLPLLTCRCTSPPHPSPPIPLPPQFTTHTPIPPSPPT